MEKISGTDRVRNEDVLHRVMEDRSILPTIESRRTNWIVHILRKNCLLENFIEVKTEGV
jgi:hypothetical protein